MTAEAKVQRTQIARAAGRMANRQLAGAFDRWAEMAREAREMRVILER